MLKVNFKITPRLSWLKSLALGLAVSLCFFPLIAHSEEPPTKTDSPQGLTIRKIKIEVRDVFDGPELAWFYKAVNKIKISTKENVVKRELLFKEGEPFDPFLIAESERNLRGLPFLRRVSIIPIQEPPYVDLIVSVQDTWTLYPTVGFSTGGGSDKKSLGIFEGNFLGYGKRLEVIASEEDESQKLQGVWDDNRVWGSKQRLTLGYFDRDDGYSSVGYFGRPFRSLIDKDAWDVVTQFADTVEKLYHDGTESFIYRDKTDRVSASYTISQGDPEKMLRRFSFGYDYENEKFDLPDEQDFEDVNVEPGDVSVDPALLAEDRKYSGPFVGFAAIEPDFLSINYIDKFDRVEDFNLGNVLSARAAFAAESLGSAENTLLMEINDSDGSRISPTSFVRGELGANGRANSEGFDDIIGHAEFKYYNVLGAKFFREIYLGKHTLATSMRLDYGEDLDRDRQFLLGAGTGLRGYEDRAFDGSQRLIINLEDRIHFVEDVYKLINIGTVFFADIGGTSSNGIGDILTDELRGDVGLGFRIGFPRSSGGSVLRIDLAFPLRSGPEGTDPWEPRLLISTSQVFNARLQSESSGIRPSNITVNQLAR